MPDFFYGLNDEFLRKRENDISTVTVLGHRGLESRNTQAAVFVVALSAKTEPVCLACSNLF